MCTQAYTLSTQRAMLSGTRKKAKTECIGKDNTYDNGRKKTQKKITIQDETKNK